MKGGNTARNITYWAVGVDCEDAGRLAALPLEKNKKFYKKIFTEKEMAYCMQKRDPYPCLAARFAAKEAVIKALPSELKLGLNEIEVKHYRDGQPYVIVKRDHDLCQSENMRVSLSHSGRMAVAVVMVIVMTL